MADFGKAVAEEFRFLRRAEEGRPINTSAGAQSNGVDREVREQVLADLDGLIEKHGAKLVAEDTSWCYDPEERCLMPLCIHGRRGSCRDCGALGRAPHA